MPAPLPVKKRRDREQNERRQKGPDHGSGHAARSEAGILRCCCCVLHGSRLGSPLAHILALLRPVAGVSPRLASATRFRSASLSTFLSLLFFLSYTCTPRAYTLTLSLFPSLSLSSIQPHSFARARNLAHDDARVHTVHRVYESAFSRPSVRSSSSPRAMFAAPMDARPSEYRAAVSRRGCFYRESTFALQTSGGARVRRASSAS